MKTPSELPATAERRLPAAIAHTETILVIPHTPYDVRTNMKEGSIRLGAGATEQNRIPAPLILHVCGFRTVRSIKLSEQYDKPCNVSQLLGIASVRGKKAWVCVTLSGLSSSQTEQSMKELLLEGGISENVVSLSARKETTKKGSFYIADFAYRKATTDDIDLMIALFEARPDAHTAFPPLRDVSEKIDTETGEVLS